jgi:DNA-binding SARP family transcriptional activator/tetratricopeptide (TPR) repeat protein
MEFQVLGPLVAHKDGVPVVLGPPVQRRLLAVLLCHADRPVPVDELCDLLWLGSPPPGARKTLQVHVHRLRRLLGPDRILHEAAGYRLVANPDELDVARFATLVERARAARHEQALHASHALLERALALWRGEPYADVAAFGIVSDERQRLVEQRLLALEDAAGVSLDLRRHAELVPELQQLVRTYPYRERLRALLILGLYRCGRQSEALEVFRATRALLNAELGLEPGTTLQRLHEAVLRGDDRLPRVASASLDDVWEAVPVQPVQPDTVVPRQLPFAAVGFTGRRRQLKELDELLGPAEPQTDPAGVALAVITGTAGVGKTTLAVRWAHTVAERFPDGQLYVNLRGFDPSGAVVSPAEAVRGFLDAFDVPRDRIPASVEGQLALYRSTLAGKRVLVLLDNARDASHARPLLPGSRGCLTLVTSRDSLSGLVAAEGARAIWLDLLTLEEGRDLMTRRLGSERTDPEPATVDEIVRRCARLPLALAVVAARAVAQPAHPLAAIADGLARSGASLNALSTGEAATDVRSVFSWSYDTLSPAAARLFRLLGLHPGPDADALAVASLAAVSPQAVREQLAELVRARLVTEQLTGRYAFHDLLRAYAAELADGPEREDALRRLFHHYLHGAYAAYQAVDPLSLDLDFSPSPPPAGTIRLELADEEQADAWLASEWGVLVAVIQHAAALGFYGHAWHLTRLVAPYLDVSGRWQAWETILRSALQAAERLGDRSAQSLALRTLARVLSRTGRSDDALTLLDQGLALSTELGHEIGQARIHAVLGGMLQNDGQLEESHRHLLRALELFQSAGDRLGEAYALNEVGWSYAQLGDYRQALALCRRALEVNEDVGDVGYDAATWDSLGYIHHQLGEYDEAVSCYQRSLELYGTLADLYHTALTLSNLGDTQKALGDAEASRRTWESALRILEDLGHRYAERVRAKLHQS